MSETIGQSDPKVHQVFLWIVQGATHGQAVKAIEKTYPDDNPETLIKLAMEEIAKSGSISELEVYGWCFEAYRDLYRRMVESGDFVGALKAVKMISDLPKEADDGEGE